ncbi:MAG TPA: MmcB family DNA repair protein, partial [Kaistia sp.]|nr:MmcB family DNA repair protein [Kaistia sp.]
GEITIVEIKSSIADFRADGKWPDYAPYCDRLYFASHAGVPQEIFPEQAGLILADAYGAEILREAPHAPLVAARRKAMTLRFAQAAAHRLHGLFDPEAGFRELL